EPNPAHYDTVLTVLKRLSRRVSRRQGPDRRTGQKPSTRWGKANAERNRVHYRVANLRDDALHKLTTRLTAGYGSVVVEDLNLAGLAAACTTGTGVAGDQGAQAPKPRGADQKTRATRRGRKATAGRAGGTSLPHQQQKEARDRRQAEALTLW